MKCVACLGGKSDILGTIGSWKDTLPDEDVLASLKSWLEVNLKEVTDPEIIALCNV